MERRIKRHGLVWIGRFCLVVVVASVAARLESTGQQRLV